MLNDKIILIDDQEIILGFINDEEHSVLRDFDSLWDSVVKQEKISYFRLQKVGILSISKG
mgnify:CR=1 FL=1